MTPVLALSIVAVVGILVQLIVAPRLVTLGELFSAGVSAEEYREQRFEFAEYTSGVKGVGNYLVNVAVTSLIPIVLFASFLAKRSSSAYRLTFYVLMLLLVIRAGFTGHKANLMIAVFSLITIHLFVKDEGRVRLRKSHVLGLAATIFVVVPTLYYVQYAAFISGYIEAFDAGIYRLFVEPNRALQLYVYFFPDLIGHLHGSSSRVFSALFTDTVEFIPPHTLLPMSWGITDVTWNVVYVGDAWADFGIFGVMAESLLVGIMLKLLDLWFWNYSQRGWLEIGVLFAEMFSVVRLGFAGLATILLGFGIIPSMLLWALAVSSKSKRSTNSIDIKV